MVTGTASTPSNIRVSVSQGPGNEASPVERIDEDLLRQLAEVKVYTDDRTFKLSNCLQESQCATTSINKQLKVVDEWGRCWQFNLAPKKTCQGIVTIPYCFPGRSENNTILWSLSDIQGSRQHSGSND